MTARDQLYVVCMFEVGVCLHKNFLRMSISHKMVLFGGKSESITKVTLLI